MVVLTVTGTILRNKVSARTFIRTAKCSLSQSIIAGYIPSDTLETRTSLIRSIINSSRETINQDLSKTKGAVKVVLNIRDDISTMIQRAVVPEEKLSLKSFDELLQEWLAPVFCVDALQLQRVTFDHSSGLILEKVARNESVHRVRTLSELKRRLHDGRRCFALLHHCLPEEPLVFVHVALTSALATSIKELDTFKNETEPSHAMFYSINSPISGLRGLELAPLLMHETVAALQVSFPSLKTFSTLSPIPSFAHWLRSVHIDRDETIHQLHNILQQDLASSSSSSIDSSNSSISAAGNSNNLNNLNVDGLLAVLQKSSDRFGPTPASTSDSPSSSPVLKELLLRVGAQFLTQVKSRGDSALPYDPVARFHLRNGASLHSLNWMANPSSSGLTSSCGMMVNYLYDLPIVPERKESYSQSLSKGGTGKHSIEEEK